MHPLRLPCIDGLEIATSRLEPPLEAPAAATPPPLHPLLSFLLRELPTPFQHPISDYYSENFPRLQHFSHTTAGGLTAAKAFKAARIYVGLQTKEMADLALVTCDVGANVAGDGFTFWCYNYLCSHDITFQACLDHGFFYFTNRGIDGELYRQLLHYSSRLSPLDPRFKGDDHRVLADPTADQFEVDSNLALTKGLHALLVFSLSGSPVSAITNVRPNFVLLLGLRQTQPFEKEQVSQ
ncbi:hypothetical protein KSP40_PGU009612 [Platanthera guangdongensis]|uniref:Uncharacterized protein n=1 Tax=Platanthera guangdongensis TaxID=2320717 RepID=A0ABR2MID8_9ASPA